MSLVKTEKEIQWRLKVFLSPAQKVHRPLWSMAQALPEYEALETAKHEAEAATKSATSNPAHDYPRTFK